MQTKNKELKQKVKNKECTIVLNTKHDDNI